MTTLLLHNATREAIQSFIAKPAHGLAFVAPAGAGKTAAAEYLASQLLNIEPSKLAGHPYFKAVRSTNGKTISVEAVRDAIHFTTLKTPSEANRAITRIILIEDAHLMNTQAQNALLKTIEEPPAGTLIILTTLSELSLLPTIRSRIQRIPIQVPSHQDTTAYFAQAGLPSAEISKALMMSGGLPGLMQALLDHADHPLIDATTIAKDILQKSTFERLIVADDLAKQRQLWQDTLFILCQMATIAIQRQADNLATVRRWHKILSACYQAQAQTLANTQTKLVVLNFMLEL